MFQHLLGFILIWHLNLINGMPTLSMKHPSKNNKTHGDEISQIQRLEAYGPEAMTKDFMEVESGHGGVEEGNLEIRGLGLPNWMRFGKKKKSKAVEEQEPERATTPMDKFKRTREFQVQRNRIKAAARSAEAKRNEGKDPCACFWGTALCIPQYAKNQA